MSDSVHAVKRDDDTLVVAADLNHAVVAFDVHEPAKGGKAYDIPAVIADGGSVIGNKTEFNNTTVTQGDKVANRPEDAVVERADDLVNADGLSAHHKPDIGKGAGERSHLLHLLDNGWKVVRLEHRTGQILEYPASGDVLLRHSFPSGQQIEFMRSGTVRSAGFRGVRVDGKTHHFPDGTTNRAENGTTNTPGRVARAEGGEQGGEGER